MIHSRDMMKLLVKEVAQAKGYKNAKALADDMGMSYGVLYPLWDNRVQRVDLATLERLCKHLQVQPGMLIIWLDEDELKGEAAPKGEPVKQAGRQGRQARPRGPKSHARKAAPKAATV